MMSVMLCSIRHWATGHNWTDGPGWGQKKPCSLWRTGYLPDHAAEHAKGAIMMRIVGWITISLWALVACQGAGNTGEVIASVDTANPPVDVTGPPVDTLRVVDAGVPDVPPTLCSGDPLLHDVPMSTDMTALAERFDTNAQLLRIVVIVSPG